MRDELSEKMRIYRQCRVLTSVVFRRGPTYYGGTKGSVNDTTPGGYRVVHGNGFKSAYQCTIFVSCDCSE